MIPAQLPLQHFLEISKVHNNEMHVSNDPLLEEIEFPFSENENRVLLQGSVTCFSGKCRSCKDVSRH
jgi:hypothetical protein